jgi:hypothetical protein
MTTGGATRAQREEDALAEQNKQKKVGRVKMGIEKRTCGRQAA